MRYYKHKNEMKELGFADFNTVESVRPYNTTIDCTIFEVHYAGREYTFQASSNSEMRRWVDVMESVRISIQMQIKKANEALILSEKPIRIRIYDEQGEEVFKTLVRKNLNDLYFLDDDLTISDHLQDQMIVGW